MQKFVPNGHFWGDGGGGGGGAYTSERIKSFDLISGAPNDGFLPNALKICFRLSGVLLKFHICFLSSTIKFLSVRSS